MGPRNRQLFLLLTAWRLPGGRAVPEPGGFLEQEVVTTAAPVAPGAAPQVRLRRVERSLLSGGVRSSGLSPPSAPSTAASWAPSPPGAVVTVPHTSCLKTTQTPSFTTGAQPSKIQVLSGLCCFWKLLEAAGPPPSSKFSTRTSACIAPSLLPPPGSPFPSQENLCAHSGPIKEAFLIIKKK